MSNTKNLTVSLTVKEHEDLEYLIEYFQHQSISTVTRSDVIKFMIRQTKRQAQQDIVAKVNKIIIESEEENQEQE